MNKNIIFIFLAAISLTSCLKSYNIQGTSDVANLDGRMLYLKVYSNSELKTMDSCDVVHGQFMFSGSVDTTKMATLFMDDHSIMPIVLEEGDISIKIDNMQQRASGTPLNEKLFHFLDSYNRIINQMDELGHKQSQAIMNGEEEHVINTKLMQEANKITQEEDRLVTTFITENFDNVLGPGVFFMMTAGLQYPELQPWIEDIMSKATEHFKNDSYVKDFYEKAIQNEAIMNGTATADQQPEPQAEAAQESTPYIYDEAPTPNEMAQPSTEQPTE